MSWRSSLLARQLALSSDERQLIGKALAAAPTVQALVRRWPVPGREVYRLFRQAGGAAPEAVLLAALPGGWSGPYEELLERALQRHFWPEPPLLSGIEVMQLLCLEPGPRVGQVLEEIEEARADGLLRTHEDAVNWLRERAKRVVE
jgi:hypothetical protein